MFTQPGLLSIYCAAFRHAPACRGTTTARIRGPLSSAFSASHARRARTRRAPTPQVTPAAPSACQLLSASIQETAGDLYYRDAQLSRLPAGCAMHPAVCSACPAGSYSPTTAASSLSACLTCSANTIAASSGSGTCTACPADAVDLSRQVAPSAPAHLHACPHAPTQ